MFGSPELRPPEPDSEREGLDRGIIFDPHRGNNERPEPLIDEPGEATPGRIELPEEKPKEEPSEPENPEE